jgi:hypothetical protein
MEESEESDNAVHPPLLLVALFDAKSRRRLTVIQAPNQ